MACQSDAVEPAVEMITVTDGNQKCRNEQKCLRKQKADKTEDAGNAEGEEKSILEADICGEETVIIFPDIGKGKEPQKHKIFAGTAHREQEEVLPVNLQCLKLGKKCLIQMKYRCINIAAQQICGQTAHRQSGGSEKKNADGNDRQLFFCFIFDSSGIIHKKYICPVFGTSTGQLLVDLIYYMMLQM